MISFIQSFLSNAAHSAQWKRCVKHTKESGGDHVVAQVGVRVEASDRFAAPRTVDAGPVRTLVTVSPAGAAVAAEGYGVGEDGVGRSRAAGKDGRAVLHLVVGAASLDEEAWAK